ncbi:MAG: leucine-rich repeat domain-containing protein [Bacteroidales bacterium]|nr:leucine-rich repeat domain-containing protein [Bacteroidales bacterium]
MDMKYTALYWALRFVENDLDIHTKAYGDYKITINAEKQTVDYGNAIMSENNGLFRHKDFVIFECVDRLLSKGYAPSSIKICAVGSPQDIIVLGKNSEDISIICEQWGNDFETASTSFSASDNPYSVLYTSRLASGLLEFKSHIIANETDYNHGIFEDNAPLSNYKLTKAKSAQIEQTNDIADFEIFEDELVTYKGKSKIVKVPNGVITIGASAFWNNTFVEKIILPDSLERIGGDCFYYCTNLKKVNIPCRVWIMGNNPFAGCPLIEITNNSPSFILENGVLFNSDKTNLIHYTIEKPDTEYYVPDGVICLGKHCFYACDNLKRIIVPSSVIRFENNPFACCTKLDIENHSPYYIFESGIIYNKFKTTIVGCLNKTELDRFVVPESVTLISRNSFWNCKGIRHIVLTKNIDRIGYNPFAGCESLLIESENPLFKIVDGIVYNPEKTHLLCATDKAVGQFFKIPDGVTHINRGVFSGCSSLQSIDFNQVTYIDKSSFTNCTSLKEIVLSDKVTYIGEWAFSYCNNLLKASIGKNTFIDKNAFNECPVAIEWRG